MSCAVNGRPYQRMVLDTGAPAGSLHEDVVSDLNLVPDPQGTVHVDSFRAGTLEIGPVRLRTASFGQNRIDGLLGTRELACFCVSLDLDRRLCTLGDSMYRSLPGSTFELFRGRPLVRVEHEAVDLAFVLDTGSNGNWLFPSGQAKLMQSGRELPCARPATAAQGELLVRRRILDRMVLGGRQMQNVEFLLAEPGQFGPNPPEDGILGLGALVSTGTVVIDFRLGRVAFTNGMQGGARA